MDRPETIELVGQTLRWSEGRIAYESAPPPDLPRLVTSPDLGEGDGWECVVRVCGDNRVYIRAPTLPALDLALRAALAEVADAVAAWLPEREASVRAEERERCAAVADRVRDGLDAGDDPYGDGLADASRLIAKEIRALTPAVRT